MNDYEITQKLSELLEKTFSYHAPKNDQPERYIMLRDKTKDLAYIIVQNTPPSREQSLAITHLEAVVFYANAAIARGE